MSKRGSILAGLDARVNRDTRAVQAPEVKTFRAFLETQSRVPIGGGEFGPYCFKGREALIEFVETIDRILGSTTGKPIKDATLSLCGGAQFGKSTTELALGAYITGCRFMNWGFYLPDEELVQGMVDTKFRPEVIDQIDWFAQMTQVGKATNKSGKAVNRKGAFSVTDGQRRSQGMILGLNKVPTSFTFDITTLDEVDDIKPAREKFVRGRMTSSKQRTMVKIGTQRVAGRGQHKAWKDGSQGMMMHRCPACSFELNIEELWPQTMRVALDGTPKRTDPQLTLTADFRHTEKGPSVATYDPTHHYYHACNRCGTELDRSEKGFRWVHKVPEKARLEIWSWRISQFGIGAIDCSQHVAHWARAVVDPEEMISFNCDVRAMPESSEQKLTEIILHRARTVAPYTMPAQFGGTRFAGLDTGRRCWFLARERQTIETKRLVHLEAIALGNVVERTTALCQLHKIDVLFCDQNPATDEVRTLALRLNGLEGLDLWPKKPEGDGRVSFPSGLQWDGKQWRGLRCAVVAFTKKKRGSGISHGFDVFEKNGKTMFVPLIECNRFETIDRAVREFLTPTENVSDVIVEKEGSRIRVLPSLLLPSRGGGNETVLKLLDEHLLTGSEREEGDVGDYVDKCENHFLLADGYSALAETVGGPESKAQAFGFQTIGTEDGIKPGRRVVL